MLYMCRSGVYIYITHGIYMKKEVTYRENVVIHAMRAIRRHRDRKENGLNSLKKMHMF